MILELTKFSSKAHLFSRLKTPKGGHSEVTPPNSMQLAIEVLEEMIEETKSDTFYSGKFQ